MKDASKLESGKLATGRWVLCVDKEIKLLMSLIDRMVGSQFFNQVWLDTWPEFLSGSLWNDKFTSMNI
jgi:hypothetical protein